MPFQMLERKPLGCQSIQMFQLFPNLSFCTGPYRGGRTLQWQLPVKMWGRLETGVCPAVTAGGTYGLQQPHFVPVCFWPHQLLLKDRRCILFFSDMTHMFTQCRDGGFSAHTACHCINFRENWWGMVWQPAEPCGAARETSSVLREK